MSRKTSLVLILLLLILAPVVWFYQVRFEERLPRIAWQGVGDYLGRKQVVRLTVSDPESGIRRVRVSLVQGDSPKVILEESFPSLAWWQGGDRKKVDFEFTIEPLKLGLSNGKARWETEVWDYSLRGWLQGNRAVSVRPVEIDTAYPVISVVANTVYLNQGGCGVVLYRVSKDVAEQGIRVNGRLYRGYPVAGHNRLYEAFFALPYSTSEVSLEIVATDRAGNRSTSRFPYHVRKQHFRKDRLVLSDGFLAKIASRFATRYPEMAAGKTPLDVFLAVNSKMRKLNNEEFVKICSKSRPERLWSGAFVPLKNASARARFADHRTYLYRGKPVATSVHLGLDLASLAGAPVPAGNNGVVVATRDIGIYGNTVVIDHGMGLFSTYSHLSRFSVAKGQRVAKGDVIGYTGSTGLAGGDHLHFGIAVQGTFVNPVEWLDPAWVLKKVEEPIRTAVEPDK